MLTTHTPARHRFLWILPVVVCWSGLTAFAAEGLFPDHVAFDDYPVEELLEVVNGRIERVQEQGETILRWHINTGQTSQLLLRDTHPLFGRLRYYDRMRFEYRIASGLVNSLAFRAVGHVSGPRHYKPHLWTHAIRTTPVGAWRRGIMELARPDRLLHPNPDGEPVRGEFGFYAMSIEPDTVVELRNIQLVRGLLIMKPDFEEPISWPIKTVLDDGGVKYTLPLLVLNASSQPQRIEPRIISRHEHFQVQITPELGYAMHSRIARFELTATMSAASIAATKELYSEPVVVSFTPDRSPEGTILWQGRFVRPLSPDVHRMAYVSPEELATIRKGIADDTLGMRGWLNYDKTLAFSNDYLTKRLDALPHSTHHVRNGYPGVTINGRRGSLRPGSFMPEAVLPGTDYREVGTDRAGQTWYNYMGYADRANEHLGMAYLLTGDEKYAQKGIELLELYAQQFTEKAWTYWRDVPWNLGTTVGASSRIADFATYGSNWYMKGLSRLANMIADSPSWTDDSRNRVYQRFVVPYITELTKITGTIGNQQDITNHNLLLLGLAFDDATCVYHALLTDAGGISRVSDIEPDGFSSEGRPLNYHFAAMNEYMPTLAFVANAGLKIDYPKERLLAAIRMPYQRASLNGIVPGAGDSGRGHGPHNNGNADYLISIFPDQDWLYEVGGAGTITKQLWLLRTGKHGDPDAWRQFLDPNPILFPYAGMAILRTGDTVEKQVMVTFDFGRNTGHAARDRNYIAITAFGKRFTQDTGSGYNVGSGGLVKPDNPRLNSFTNAGSLGQNVIMVDATNQSPAIGRLQAYSDKLDYQVAVATVPGVQPGVSHTRGVVLSHGVIILLDRISSEDQHTYDMLYHNFGKSQLGPGWTAAPMDQPLATTANYPNLVDLKKLSGQGTLRMSWDLTRQLPPSVLANTDDKDLQPYGLELWQLPIQGAELYTAVTAGNNKDTTGMPDPMPSLISRVTGKSVNWITVLEPHRGKSNVKTVEATNNGGVRVTLTNGQHIEAQLDDLLKRYKVNPQTVAP